jgi:SAM-dependent methyltransferase
MDAAAAGRMYDELVADHYDADPFGCRRAAYEAVTRQLQRYARGKSIEQIVDVAMGTGSGLLACRPLFPEARMLGVDASRKMIERGRRKLDVEAFHGDCLESERWVSPGSADVALIHFVMAYVPPVKMLRVVSSLLKPGALLSVATTTFDTFPTLQELTVQHGVSSREAIKANGHVPDNPEGLASLLEAQGFEVLEGERVQVPVDFASFDALFDFGLNSGWLTHFFARVQREQLAVQLPIERAFPLQDEFRAYVATARKRD